MHLAQLVPLMAFLGIRTRYWAIIIVVILVLLALAYFARARAV
jgi:hypothetical protein